MTMDKEAAGQAPCILLPSDKLASEAQQTRPDYASYFLHKQAHISLANEAQQTVLDCAS